MRAPHQQVLGTRRAWTSLFVVVLAVGLIGMLVPEAGAAPGTCQVVNARTRAKSVGDGANLQASIASAASGDTLHITGTCVGTFSIEKNLTLRGRVSGKQIPTLNGNGAGTVVTIPNLSINSVVTIDGLTVRNGGNTSFGGGILNAGVLTVTNSMITGNIADSRGGGLANFDVATVRNSTISGNSVTGPPTGTGWGGGITNAPLGNLVLTNTKVSGNMAVQGAGVENDNDLTLAGTSAITGNSASTSGGGIYIVTGYNTDPAVYAADGTSAHTDPVSGAVLPAWTGSVSGNTPDQCNPPLTISGAACS